MSSSEPSQTSGVVLTRGAGGELELFWARRPHDAGFMGGFFSYFVGRVEREDHSTPLDVDEGELAVAREFYAAATRELFEESGLNFEASRLAHLGGWRTPSWLDEDFYTEFFWLHLSDEECERLGVDELHKKVDRDEIAFSEWIRPEDALERWSTGRAPMTPPLVAVLDIFAHTPLDEVAGELDRRRDAHRRDAPMEIVGGLSVLPLETATIPPATHTNCYFVGDERFVVIDPGSADDAELELLFGAIDGFLEQGRGLAAVVLTHHHRDHVSGVSALVERYDAEVWAHHELVARLKDLPVDRELEDGEAIELGPDTLTCLHTPGHAPDHLCLFHERTKSVIAGDLVASKGTIVINPPEGHVGQYMESLRRIRELGPRTIFPAHGWAITDPRGRLDFYISHRMKRERGILEALRRASTSVTPIDLVPEVYDDVPAHVWPLAARSLLAHLVHLVEEDFAETDGQKFWATENLGG
ncbi:MBL fold metallo-hydrolase [Persicimonas caeni]|nr:MBL fold metallo-hydrolase [Persicimonas caeni]